MSRAVAYIYKKIAGGKEYYYLRVSTRKGAKTHTKDIAYLGNSLQEAQRRIQLLPQKAIRSAYKTIRRFIESNTYLEQARSAKTRQSPFLDKPLLEEIEACRLHWQKTARTSNPLTFKERLRDFAVDLAFNTTSIEGNTITLKEAARLLTEQIAPKNRTLREIYDLQNTERAFLLIVDSPSELNHGTIIAMHKELMEGIDTRTGYRSQDVRVIHSRFDATPAPYIKTDMDLLLRWQRGQTMHPFALASIFHHKFEKIHPFFDGNGRTGRMIMNAILLKNGYPPIIVRKKNRPAYLEALSKADKAGLSDAPPDTYKQLVKFLAGEYRDTYWDSFI